MTPAGEIAIEWHPLQPFLPPHARLLMLGSFPPPHKRWCMEFFYPNRTNQMCFTLMQSRLHFKDFRKENRSRIKKLFNA